MWNNRDRGEPENEGNGVLIFVYLWTVVSWLVVSKLVYQAALARDYFGVRNSLMGFANVSFLVCVLLAGTKETIQMEGREIEETGWYGQTSVLVFLTNVLALLGCLACAVWAHNLAKRSIQNHKDTDAILNGGFVEMGGGDDVVEGGMNQETLTVAAVSPSQSA